MLTKLERLALYRSVYSLNVSKARRSKALPPSSIAGERLIIDGFNVASIVLSALEGRLLLLGTDGFVRDVASLTRKLKVDVKLLASLSVTVSAIARLRPSTATFFFDSQVSKSALAAFTARELLGLAGIRGNAELVKRADKASIHVEGAVVCTADSVILDRVSRAFDLGGYVARLIAPERILDIARLLVSVKGVPCLEENVT